MLVILSIVFAILAAFFVILIAGYVRKKNEVDIFRRMRRHHFAEITTPAKKSKETFRQTFFRLVKNLSKPLEPLEDTAIFSKLDLKLKQAGIKIKSSEFVVAILFLAMVGGLLIYMITINFSVAVLAMLLIPLGIWFAILILIQRRKNSFSEQLGDCLITIANALRAGYSFQQAADIIAKEMEPPVSDEFERLTADIKMGIPVETALKVMDKSVDNADFTLVITAVLIQREVGGNLAQVLDSISDTIMERVRMKREINALTAQGKFSAVVLVILPFVVGAFMFMVNPSQIELLFTESAGQIAIVAALIMDIIGFLFIRRIVNIEV